MLLNNRYELLERIGEGGTATVYLGWDNHMEQKVAIKRLKRNGEKSVRQFMSEADFIKRLCHPMIPVIYDIAEHKGWYLVMEYADGMSLRKYVERNGMMDEKSARACAVGLLQCLCYLHNLKPPVIYCDLKPDNIVVCKDGNWKLIDWGAAFCMQYDGKMPDFLAATKGFAAPEQLPERRNGNEGGVGAGSGKIDIRSDLYAFGRLLYYMVTGADPAQPPYGALSIRCYNPVLSDSLGQVIRICTEKEPEKRYQTAEEILQVLKKEKRRTSGGRKRDFIRRVEKQIWLTEQKEECTFYGDSCIITED